MIQITDKNCAIPKQKLKVTPDILRNIAHQMELGGQGAIPGQLITLQVASSIEFVYDPEISMERFHRERDGV